MRAWVHELSSNTQLMRRLHADPTYHTNKRNYATVIITNTTI